MTILKATSNAGSAVLRRSWVLYNFTRSDMKTTLLPQTLFSLAGAFSGYPITSATFTVTKAIWNWPIVIVWLWLCLLVFTMANQRLPDSIVEDSHNKPWRNIPSALISANETRELLAIVVVGLWVVSLVLGVWNEFAALCVLTWVYNDLGMDKHYLLRGFMNGAGYTCFAMGGLKLATKIKFDVSGQSVNLGPAAVPWTILVGAAIATTIQVQDIQDQTGDRARGRQTMPLVLGDRFCRWTVALTVPVWSIIACVFWDLETPFHCLISSLSLIVAFRALFYGYNGSVESPERALQDKTTFLTWCIWLGALYLLPLGRSR